MGSKVANTRWELNATIAGTIALLSSFVGGWLLILSHGVWLALTGDHPDWYPLPSHPIARITVYLTAAVLLQFLSAWLLISTRAERGIRDWRQYGLQVVGCICGCFIAVMVMLVVALFFCTDC